MLYFAYGSNMDPEGMRQRAPGARALGAARLSGWRLTFTRALGEGVWHIERAPGDEVWGVLWDVTESDVLLLDRYEGVAGGAYTRETIRIAYESGEDGALVYLAVSDGDASPSTEDVAVLVRGAEAHGLPATYAEHIRRVLAP